MDFLGGSAVKNPPANTENVGSIPELGWEDPLEKEIATHSIILAWEVLWTEEPGRLQSMGVTKVSDTTQSLNNSFLALQDKKISSLLTPLPPLFRNSKFVFHLLLIYIFKVYNYNIHFTQLLSFTPTVK